MFNCTKCKVLEETLAVVREDYRQLQSVHESDAATHKAELELIDHKMEMEVEKKVADKQKELEALKLKSGVQEKEIEILRKAFENLGFDVKDMKDILDKLVDGLIAKNEIKLIK